MLINLISLDISLFYWINQTWPHPDWLNAIFIFSDQMFAVGAFWIVFCLFLLLSKNSKHILFGKWGLITLSLTAFIEGALIKTVIARPRPYDVLDDVWLSSIKPITYSFPSGHATTTMAMATLFWLIFPRTKSAYVLVLLTVFTSIGRIYLGAHYPSDVAAGLVIGWLCGYISFRLLHKFS